MIKKSALTDLTRQQALFHFKEAKSIPGAVAEMIEQSNGLWTVTVVWDDAGTSLAQADLDGFDRAAAPPPSSEPGDDPPLGSLSARFESNGSAGAIGHDQTGGFSYGTYQLASRKGRVQEFLDFLAEKRPEWAKRLDSAGGDTGARKGTAAFRNAWQALAADPDFGAAQHDFIAATHFEPFARRLRKGLGLDLAARSAALRDVAWSVAVQHGPGSAVFERALDGVDPSTLDDATIIQRVYAERSNVGLYFPSSTEPVRVAVARRFESELQEALRRLA